MRPDPERIDVLCVGVVAYAGDQWHIIALPSAQKIQAVFPEFSSPDLSAISANLPNLFSECASIGHAREFLAKTRSAIQLDEFEGSFVFDSEAEFNQHMQAIMEESVLPRGHDSRHELVRKKARPRLRAQLRRQFERMNIFGKTAEAINDHKIVSQYPISAKHGLYAEFALKNSVMNITETIDFDVVDELMRNKTFEAQAKCLVMRAAVESFGDNTKRHIVVSGGGSDRASRSIDLLSTVGEIYALENASDMQAYFNLIEQTARQG